MSERRATLAEIAALLAGCSSDICIELPDRLFAHVSLVDAPSGVLAVMAIPDAGGGGAHRQLRGARRRAGSGQPRHHHAHCRGGRVADVLLTPGCAQAWSPGCCGRRWGALRAAHPRSCRCRHCAAWLSGRDPAADLRDSVELYDLDLRGPVAWLFGSEGQGLSQAVAGLATKRVLIPMPGGMESLNVGVAAGVCLFEQLRQRARQAAEGSSSDAAAAAALPSGWKRTTPAAAPACGP